jgi:hypothetical protein
MIYSFCSDFPSQNYVPLSSILFCQSMFSHTASYSIHRSWVFSSFVCLPFSILGFFVAVYLPAFPLRIQIIVIVFLQLPLIARALALHRVELNTRRSSGSVNTIFRKRGYAFAQLIEALRYNPADHGFDSRLGHWDFLLTSFFLPHCGPGVSTRSISWG